VRHASRVADFETPDKQRQWQTYLLNHTIRWKRPMKTTIYRLLRCGYEGTALG
jgi:hypothetical protein